jgi:hypothetical protein
MNLRPVCLSLVAGAFAILGCSGSTYLHGKALEQNQYRGYGEYHPERDREVLTQAQAVEAVILKLDLRMRTKLRPDEATVKGSSVAPGIEQL